MDWNFFCRQLEAGYHIDETYFYFSDDAEEEEHYIGCIAKYEHPYWAGYSDIPNGCEFSTAEELVTAREYNGKSLKERWDKVVITDIEIVLGTPFRLYRILSFSNGSFTFSFENRVTCL